MNPSDRWYPVLERYICYIAAQMDGLAGDSCSILPSPNGIPAEVFKACERGYTGKVCEVFFDCFGSFKGFVLSDCSCKHVLKTQERGIEEIVLRTYRERLLLSVYVKDRYKHRIRKLIIRC